MPRLRAVLMLLAVAGVAACEHPIAVVTPHAEVADLVFTDSSSAAVVMRTTDNRVWNETPLSMPARPNVTAGSCSSPSIGAGGRSFSSCGRVRLQAECTQGASPLTCAHLPPLVSPNMYHVSFASAAGGCGCMCCSM